MEGFLESFPRYSIAAVFLALTLGSAFLFGCAGNSPTHPGSSPTPTPGIATNPNGPLIVASFGAGGAGVYIMDNAGNPVTTASVTLTFNGVSWPVTYGGITSEDLPASSGITPFTGGYYLATGMSYSPGTVCAFNFVVEGNSYSATFTASNATCGIATGSSGVTCTWAGLVNTPLVVVTGKDRLEFGPAISSPYDMPASLFVNDPAGAGNDILMLGAYEIIEPGISGCQSGSAILSGTGTSATY